MAPCRLPQACPQERPAGPPFCPGRPGPRARRVSGSGRHSQAAPGRPAAAAAACPSAAGWESRPSWEEGSCSLPLKSFHRAVLASDSGKNCDEHTTNAHDAHWQRECSTSRFSARQAKRFSFLPPRWVCVGSAAIQLWRFLKHGIGWGPCLGCTVLLAAPETVPDQLLCWVPAFCGLGSVR